jgi:chromosome segregation protein
MLLKRVSMCGFKSFCDKVDFDFGEGVTCIVGPNGCGKSNVVDAVKWVLGEQSAKALRGRQMVDMIFNGSSSRKASGVAQVDLIFDNADGTLGLDQTEVSVTRKLYRSGESEYLLNGQSARLKDLRELFLDTGVGVDAYSVIEQGRVDRLLQSSPVERRAIFEEAAGISKYKARKKEAERKLDRTNQNLLRVADVIEELEKRLRSVKLQAGKARSYQEYQQRLNELRSTYAMAEFHRFSQQIEGLTREVGETSDKATGLRTKIDRQEVESSEGAMELDRLADELSDIDNRLVQAKSELAAQIERIESAKHRIEEQSSLRARTRERQETQAARLTEAVQELDRVQASAVALQEETQTLHAKIDELNEGDRALAREITEARATLEDEKAGVLELVRRSAQTHNEIIRLNTHRDSLVDQKGRLAERDAKVATELEGVLVQKANLQHRLNEVDGIIKAETQKLEEKKEEAGRLGQYRQRLVDELAEGKERRSALGSRHELLSDLQRKMDGVGAGVKEVLAAKSRDEEGERFAAVHGIIADVFETDVAHAVVIEAALSGGDQDLLVRDSESFLADGGVFGDLPGRLTALCTDRIPPVVNARDFADQPGYVGRAIDFVRYDQEHEQLARHLFGKVIVVSDLAAALSLARQDSAGHRFVTQQGELVEPDGRVVLGPADLESGLISRKSELREIDSTLAQLDEQLASLSDQLNRTDAEAGHLDTVQHDLRTAIYESNTARVEANAGLQNVDETIARLTQEQPLIAQEVAFLEQQINEAMDKTEVSGRSLEVLERQNNEREEQVAIHEARIDELVARRDTVQQELTSYKVASGQLTEKRAAAAETINGLRRTSHELEAAVASCDSDLEQCEQRINEAKETVATGTSRVGDLRTQAEELEGKAETIRNRRDQVRLNLEALAHAIRAARSELAEVEGKLHESEMALAQANVRRDELSSRTLTELEIDLAERYAEYEHQEQDWAEVEEEIAELRGKMDRLGNVNLDAINELVELEERHEFLTTQRDDLENSHRQLAQLIETLNKESQQRFQVAFEEIRDNFRSLFRKLFGGGKADIILEDLDNALECGIEIVAQPPGKDLQSISLMSGGEKSMTAIALLMSIFRTRPAPFAFLDEVDAALDEANNDRFNRIIQEFVSEAQFMIITHSKRTMAIAGRLYGITMQEPGISTRVSVQLGDVSAA